MKKIENLIYKTYERYITNYEFFNSLIDLPLEEEYLILILIFILLYLLFLYHKNIKTNKKNLHPC